MEDYFSMTERFTFIEIPGEIGIQDELSGDVLVLMHDDANSKGFVISIINLLNELHEEKEELGSFKKLVDLVLKKEYDLRMNEMGIFAEKEEWQGYMATQLERGTVQRIAKRLGVDLE